MKNRAYSVYETTGAQNLKKMQQIYQSKLEQKNKREVILNIQKTNKAFQDQHEQLSRTVINNNYRSLSNGKKSQTIESDKSPSKQR